jgi:hypothetical protein
VGRTTVVSALGPLATLGRAWVVITLLFFLMATLVGGVGNLGSAHGVWYS